jgi:ATP-binding cassette subfamily F protein 3
VFKKVEVLSGGEKSRLALVKLLLDPPNLLLMDEPTTHLDISSIDALVDAMKQFEGTLVFISHDVHFIKALANKVVHVAAGKLTQYQGDYEFYLHKTKSISARAALTAGAVGTGKAGKPSKANTPAPARKEPAGGTKEAQRARTNQIKQIRQNVQKLEQEIERLEARKAEIEALLAQPEIWHDGPRSSELTRELDKNAARLATVSPQWEAQAVQLQALESA